MTGRMAGKRRNRVTVRSGEEDLPESLRRIAAIAGRRSALVLSAHHGGTHVSVPSHYHGDHPLSILLGPEAAEKLIRRWGGSKLYVAKMDATARSRRNIEIVRAYEGGCPAHKLARQYGLSERQVWAILKVTPI